MILWERDPVDDACVAVIWCGSRGGEDVCEAGECHFGAGLCTCLKWW